MFRIAAEWPAGGPIARIPPLAPEHHRWLQILEKTEDVADDRDGEEMGTNDDEVERDNRENVRRLIARRAASNLPLLTGPLHQAL